MNSRKALQATLMTIVLAAVTGCATNGGYQAYAPPKGKALKTIAILAPMNLESHTLLNQGGGGKLFGALGAIAEAPNDAEKMKELDKQLKQSGFDFSAVFSNALKTKLEAAGYQVAVAPVSRKKPMSLVSDTEQLRSIDADALLDVAVWSVGYANVSITDNDFRPDIKVDISLKSIDDTKLYSETIMYGYHNPFMSATDIDAPQEYYFDDRDELLANPAKALEGLMKGVEAVVGHVTQRLSEA